MKTALHKLRISHSGAVMHDPAEGGVTVTDNTATSIALTNRVGSE